MSAPTLTLAEIAGLEPCQTRLDEMQRILPHDRPITAAEAREAGATREDVVWAASAVACTNSDVERRVRLWLADCAAHVLHVYEREEASDAPRQAIIAARAYVRGEIDDVTRAAAEAAVRDAAWAAAGAVAGTAAWYATWYAAWYATRTAEEAWQFDRLVAWLSDDEPDDWPLPERAVDRRADAA